MKDPGESLQLLGGSPLKFQGNLIENKEDQKENLPLISKHKINFIKKPVEYVTNDQGDVPDKTQK